MSTKPEALRLADECEESAQVWAHEIDTRQRAAAELRRLHVQSAQDEALLRQALGALGRYCKRPKGADFTMEAEEFRLYATEVMGLPAPANRAGLIEPTRSFAIAAQQGGAA